MKLILEKQELNIVLSYVEDVIDKRKLLPDYIFRSGYESFSFITFDEIFMPHFFGHICRYVEEIGDDRLLLAVVDPDPLLYFGAHFDFYGVVQFSPLDTVESYISSLNDYPKCSPADALAHNSNSLVFFSDSKDWVIYGNRDSDIVICAFSDKRQLGVFESIYGDDLLPGVKSAADYGYPDNESLRRNLIRNYKTD